MKRGRTVLQAKRYGTHRCSHTASLLDIAQQMVEREINTMVVVDDDGYLAGIITRMDLLRAYLDHDDWARLPVNQFMRSDVVVVTPDTLLLDAARLVADHRIHQVIVVEIEHDRQRPVAVLSATDMIYHMVKSEP